MPRTWSTDFTRPSMRRVRLCGPVSRLPPGVIRFCVRRAFMTSTAVTFAARKSIGSIDTLIWRARPPVSETLPTPLTVSIWRLTSLSAISVTSLVLMVSLDKPKNSTGDAVGSTFMMIGCSMSVGRSRKIRLILSRTSVAATSVFFSSTKRMITCEMPSDDTDVDVRELVDAQPSIADDAEHRDHQHQNGSQDRLLDTNSS